jgi:hypothetical protein
MSMSTKKLDKHTTEFTDAQRDELIEKIIKRAAAAYGSHRIQVDRLRKGLLCAHRAKPIRLIDLLNTCMTDFPADVLYGVYRHYDEANDTMKNGWTAQHSEPYVRTWWDNDDEEEDADEYDDYHSTY